MTCELCGKVAWYQVGKKGFCGNHRAEAVEMMRRKGDARLGKATTVYHLPERTERTHCGRGHELTGENVRLRGTRKRCLTCEREGKAARRKKVAA